MVGRYLARRVAHAVVLLPIVSVLGFALTAVAPGEFTDDMRLNPQISADTVQALRARYALDRPLPVRYAAWLRATLTGDLGFSLTYNMPVSALFWPRARNTVILAAVATTAAWLLAVPLAICSAARRGRALDRMVMMITSVPLASSDLLIGLGALWLAARSGFFPTGGMTSVGFETMSGREQWSDLRWHLMLPVAALTGILLPPIFRQARAALIDAMQSPHVQAAHAHGLSRATLLRAYVLPLAANAQISLLGLSMAGLLSASLVIEVVMSWPGVGPLLLEATLARDHHVVVGIVVVSAGLVWIANMIADALLYVADPRIRAV